MSALILSAMLSCPAMPLSDPEKSRIIKLCILNIECEEAMLLLTLRDVWQGKKPPVEIIKRTLELAVAYETRIEYWLFETSALNDLQNRLYRRFSR